MRQQGGGGASSTCRPRFASGPEVHRPEGPFPRRLVEATLFDKHTPTEHCARRGCGRSLAGNQRVSLDLCNHGIICTTCFTEKFIVQKLRFEMPVCPHCKEEWSLLSAGGEDM
mmetsp:Transcript_52780/g.72044  ORF Transcript_52780/g.72044 Transcript_52780/m.72044 type:complete len:113 (+) Transcript_52780:811-1149(+)